MDCRSSALDYDLPSAFAEHCNDLTAFVETLHDGERQTYTGPWSSGKTFSAFVTPFIVGIGLIGNLVSLRVFTATRLRKLPASQYLLALSVSDSFVLLSYVLCEWLLHGLPVWTFGSSTKSTTFAEDSEQSSASAWASLTSTGSPVSNYNKTSSSSFPAPSSQYSVDALSSTFNIDVIHKPGFCQTFLFISYVFRFVTVYLIVIFTVERYIAVSKPLQRHSISSKSAARRIIIIVHVVAVFVSLYKPLLSGLYPANISPTTILKNISDIGENRTLYTDIYSANIHFNTNTKICTWNPEYESFHYILELGYGLTITAIPFLIVTILNVLILKELVTKCRPNQARNRFRKNKIRIEFTFMVLAVSTCFVCLNIPYFIVWIIQNLQAFNPESAYVVERNSEVLSVTRTIFNVNYSINFFVYCLTGSYYRDIILNMCGVRRYRTCGAMNNQKRSSSSSYRRGRGSEDPVLGQQVDTAVNETRL